MTFNDGAISLGTGTLAPGGQGSQATFTTSALPPGNNTIMAVYGGDGNFNGSTSAPFTQTVNSVPIVDVKAISPDASEDTGQSGSFRFTRTGDITNSLAVTYAVSGTGADDNGVEYQYLPVRGQGRMTTASNINTCQVQ